MAADNVVSENAPGSFRLSIDCPEHANGVLTGKVTNGDHAADATEENNGGGNYMPRLHYGAGLG